jgi:hypothetical protein
MLSACQSLEILQLQQIISCSSDFFYCITNSKNKIIFLDKWKPFHSVIVANSKQAGKRQRQRKTETEKRDIDRGRQRQKKRKTETKEDRDRGRRRQRQRKIDTETKGERDIDRRRQTEEGRQSKSETETEEDRDRSRGRQRQRKTETEEDRDRNRGRQRQRKTKTEEDNEDRGRGRQARKQKKRQYRGRQRHCMFDNCQVLMGGEMLYFDIAIAPLFHSSFYLHYFLHLSNFICASTFGFSFRRRRKTSFGTHFVWYNISKF